MKTEMLKSLNSSKEQDSKSETKKLQKQGYSIPSSMSTNDDSLSTGEGPSEECISAKYGLDLPSTQQSLHHRILISNITENKAKFMKYFSNGVKINYLINLLKCNMCHDLLDTASQMCSVCKQSFCGDCVMKNEIVNDLNGPNKPCKGEVTQQIEEKLMFLTENIKVKCINFGNGGDIASKKLIKAYQHEKSGEYVFKTCQYGNNPKVIQKHWGEHMLNEGSAIEKCTNSTKCKFIGLKDQVIKHERNDGGYVEIEGDMGNNWILRINEQNHDGMGNLKSVLSEKEVNLKQHNDKLDKMTKDNEKLRTLLVKMKRTLLEKLECEKKCKLEIAKIKEEYPMIKIPKRVKPKFNSDNKENSIKRQKVAECETVSTSEFDKEINKAITQRNYHSKYIVGCGNDQGFTEEMENKPKTGDGIKGFGSLGKDGFKKCPKCYKQVCINGVSKGG